MAKTKFLNVRLDDRDHERVRLQAEALGVSMTEYLRYLIRLSPSPDECCHAIVIERAQLGAMRYELIRWGRHYNQAVHALNSIDYRMRHGQADNAAFRQLLLRCEANLDKVDAGRSQLEEKLSALQSMTLIGG